MTNLFIHVLEASFYGSIVIALVLVLRLVLKKAPRWTICLLWLLAAIRLLFPFDIPSSVSLQPDLAQLRQIQSEITQNPVGQAAPIQPDNVVFPDRDDVQIVIQDDAVIEEVHRVIDWSNIAAFAWVTIAASMVFYSVASYLRLKYRVREAVKLYDNVYECSGLDTAFVLGYLWPRIYIPMGLENSKYIVDHERAHICRGDHWFKLLMSAALALHWFNPLVWTAYLCTCKDLEMACDERVVRDLSLEQRKAYSAALLSCSAGHRSFAACPVAFGEVSVKSRILGVLNYRRPRFWICLIAVVAIVFVAVCFLTNPAEQEPDLSFLNYKNAISLVADQDVVSAIYYDEHSINVGMAEGNTLAVFLDHADWAERWLNPTDLASPGSVVFTVQDGYRITLYDRRFAAVEYDGEVRYYNISASDYEDAQELLLPPDNTRLDASNGAAATEESDTVQQEMDAINGMKDEIEQQIREQDILKRCQAALSGLQALESCYLTGRNEFYIYSQLYSETAVQYYLHEGNWLRIAEVRNASQIHRHLYLDGQLYNQIIGNQDSGWMSINSDSAENHLLWPFEYVWSSNAEFVNMETDDSMTRITVKVSEPVSVSGMVMDTHTLEVCLDEAGNLVSITISDMEDPSDPPASSMKLTMDVITVSKESIANILDDCGKQISEEA